ncbi:hypothetical protein L218DRAFT_907138 [Marasmius fiardii PR-910]|nr:hypothetical protein L218DRAFT_907138 [Marasmius fiardii PR-910]
MAPQNHSTTPPDLSVILEIPLQSLVNTVLDLAPFATPQRFRFFDRQKFIEDKVLSIVESAHLPEDDYIAISHLWRGNPVASENWNESIGTFNVIVPPDADEGDPISLTVLKHVCTAALLEEINGSVTPLGFEFHASRYIWLDRLCIVQTDRLDKIWQIGRMFDIYQKASSCIILPGGLQRLVRLNEETQWIHRAWTLQECLARDAEPTVLFQWERGSSEIRFSYWQRVEQLIEVIPHESALCSLRTIVDAGIKETVPIGGVHERVKILGNAKPPLVALRNCFGVNSRGEDARDYSIWQCSLMRTSSRPVDMVFSIMGLFDVSLDIPSFGKDDRLRATIALAQAILKKGRSACWLGAAYNLPVCKNLSSFPIFAKTSVSTKAYIKLSDGSMHAISDIVKCQHLVHGAPGGQLPDLFLPGGSMDSEGYLNIKRKAIGLSRPSTDSSLKDPDIIISAVDGTIWEAHSRAGSKSSTYPASFALALAWFMEYDPFEYHDPFIEARITCAIVTEHAPKRFHIQSFSHIGDESEGWVRDWEENEFKIGGPFPPSVA